jgi:TP901 family phage tail tape measure protein
VEQSVALVASSNSVLQNPSSVGNALKTVSMRLRGTDSDQIAEETGEEIEGMNTSASKLYETIRKLTSVKSNDYQGISILTSTGSFRSTFDILKDISQVWSEMNDVSKAGLLEDVAGKRQSAAVAAIFNNPNSLTSAYESANSATGASDTAMTIALDSVEAKVSKLQNSTQAFWQTLIDSDSAKKILDIVNAIVTGLDKIIAGGNSIGNLSSLVAILTGGSQIIKTIMSDQPSQYSGGRVKKFALKNMPPTGSTVMCVNCA